MLNADNNSALFPVTEQNAEVNYISDTQK
jgi:hypothetical protein